MRGTPRDAESLRARLVRQSGDHSVSFPFKFDLMSSREVYPTGKNLDIPVGGYYINFFSVYAKGSWLLEYVFPKSVDIDLVNLRAFPLNPSITVKRLFPAGNQGSSLKSNAPEMRKTTSSSSETRRQFPAGFRPGHVMNHAPSKRRVTICRIIAAPLMPKPYPPHGHRMFSGRFSCEETGTEYSSRHGRRW